MRFFRIPVALVALAGCSDGTGPQGVCPQTYEFGNYGCVVFSGRVLDGLGLPVAGVSVGPGEGADASAFNSMYATTGSDGTFSIRLTRMVPSPVAQDTATLWIRAALIPVLPQLSSTVKDSVLARFRLAPVGSPPDTIRLTLSLAIPPGQ